MLRRLAFAVIGAFAVASASHAETTSFGGTKIELTVPPGHCALDEGNRSDARLKAMLTQTIEQGGNILLGNYVDCSQLAAWRKGTRKVLDDLVQYQTQKARVDMPFGAAEVSATCKDLQQSGQVLADGAVKDMRPIFEATSKTIRLNEMKLIGVTSEEGGTCFASMLQRLQTEFGAEKMQLCVLSVISVRNKLVFYYLFTLYTEGMDLAAMIEKHRVNTRALQAANR